jgi:hypothetical protein
MGKACGMHRTVEKRIQISDEKDHWGGVGETLTWKDNIKIYFKNTASLCYLYLPS